MIGYYFSVHDNDSYAFRVYPRLTQYQKVHQTIIPDMSGESRQDVRRCPECGELLNKWNEVLKGLKIKRRRLDISCTYDGVDVVSARFKQVYESNALTGLRFIPLLDDPEFTQIQATAVVEFDAIKRGTRFEKKCPVCGRFAVVVGATPVCLEEGSVIPERGFVWTDLEFGSDDGKSPLLLCGISAGQVLTNAKLNGLDLVEI
jgi:hypothetical protein